MFWKFQNSITFLIHVIILSFFLNTTYSSRIIFRIRFVSENYNKNVKLLMIKITGIIKQMHYCSPSICIAFMVIIVWKNNIYNLNFVFVVSILLSFMLLFGLPIKGNYQCNIFRNNFFNLFNKVNPFIYQQDINYYYSFLLCKYFIQVEYIQKN